MPIANPILGQYQETNAFSESPFFAFEQSAVMARSNFPLNPANPGGLARPYTFSAQNTSAAGISTSPSSDWLIFLSDDSIFTSGTDKYNWWGSVSGSVFHVTYLLGGFTFHQWGANTASNVNMDESFWPFSFNNPGTWTLSFPIIYPNGQSTGTTAALYIVTQNSGKFAFANWAYPASAGAGWTMAGGGAPPGTFDSSSFTGTDNSPWTFRLEVSNLQPYLPSPVGTPDLQWQVTIQ